MKPFQYLVDATNNVMTLEKDLVPLLDVERKCAYEIDLTHPDIMYQSEQILEFLKEGFIEPSAILE